jgi:ketosteroid isomerase-like protein
MEGNEAKALVVAFFGTLGEGQVDRAWESLADNMTWRLMSTSPNYPMAGDYTKASYRELMNRSAGMFPDGLAMRLFNVIAEGGHVAFEAESLGTAANGKRYNNFYHFRVEVEGDRIKAVREYLDSAHAVDVLC